MPIRAHVHARSLRSFCFKRRVLSTCVAGPIARACVRQRDVYLSVWTTHERPLFGSAFPLEAE